MESLTSVRINLQVVVKQVQSSLPSPPAMEESIEIYRLRLEHKRYLEDAERFLEDAEQERTKNEKLREQLIAELHRRADAEKTIRSLTDENLKLKVKLERLQRLQREWVETPVSSHFLTNSIVW